jgi:hypothetical protein
VIDGNRDLMVDGLEALYRRRVAMYYASAASRLVSRALPLLNG